MIGCSRPPSAIIMRSGCFCLRPARDASHNAEVPQGQTDLRGPDSRTAATPGPQPVRAVSPADVRRTVSGRVIKEKAEAGLQSIREASTSGVRVIGGRQILPCETLEPQQGRSAAASAAEVQQLSRRPQAKRILQPVDVLVTDCKQEKTLLQLLRPSRKSLEPNSTGCEPDSVCKSIMEASERRLHRHKQAVTSSAATQMAVIQSFSDAYLSAVTTGDQQWASAAQIAASFSPDAVLKTQDKQTFYGKQAALKRLNSGAAASKLIHNTSEVLQLVILMVL